MKCETQKVGGEGVGEWLIFVSLVYAANPRFAVFCGCLLGFFVDGLLQGSVCRSSRSPWPGRVMESFLRLTHHGKYTWGYCKSLGSPASSGETQTLSCPGDYKNWERSHA